MRENRSIEKVLNKKRVRDRSWKRMEARRLKNLKKMYGIKSLEDEQQLIAFLATKILTNQFEDVDDVLGLFPTALQTSLLENAKRLARSFNIVESLKKM